MALQADSIDHCQAKLPGSMDTTAVADDARIIDPAIGTVVGRPVLADSIDRRQAKLPDSMDTTAVADDARIIDPAIGTVVGRPVLADSIDRRQAKLPDSMDTTVFVDVTLPFVQTRVFRASSQFFHQTT